MRLLLGLLLGCGSPSEGPPRIDPVGDDPAQIQVWAPTAQLEIRLEGASDPMAATVEPAEGGGFHLRPAAPLSRGQTYAVTAGEAVLRWTVPPPPSAPAPQVRIHPTAPVLPLNHLKFTLRFSRPMRSPPDLFDRIQLIDDRTGDPVAMAFAETPLWTPDRTQLTLLLHPGRQKTGIGFGGGSVGPVLEQGGAYTLRVDGALSDTDGRAMGAAVTRSFTVGEIDRSQPDPAAWTTEIPASAQAPLIVHFDEPLDVGTLAHAFAVHSGGAPLTLAVDPGPEERSVALTAAGGWPAGELVLERVGTVEDLAANSPERPFEKRVGAELPPPAPFRVAFQVGAAPGSAD